jgi:hypothetical protein
MNKITRIGMAAAVLIAGCGMMERDGDSTPMANPPPGATKCTKGGSDICIVTVTVGSCTSISASPDKAWVPPGDHGDVVWKLPRGWSFEGQGVVFRNPHSDFSNPRGGGSGEYRWNNAHKVLNKGHKYTLHITDGTQHCSHDPSIMN